jgi:hypothetical protein
LCEATGTPSLWFVSLFKVEGFEPSIKDFHYLTDVGRAGKMNFKGLKKGIGPNDDLLSL